MLYEERREREKGEKKVEARKSSFLIGTWASEISEDG